MLSHKIIQPLDTEWPPCGALDNIDMVFVTWLDMQNKYVCASVLTCLAKIMVWVILD